MFPLGTVLLPGSVLPLHVFEPRYRKLVEDCIAGAEHEFGVVLIERGSEVGGGDVRRDAGTKARIVQVAAMPGGRYAVVAVGTRRVRVRSWWPDDPYPIAELEDWPDDGPAVAEAQFEAIAARVRSVAGLAVELGDPARDLGAELGDDPVLASYQLVQLAPLGEADRYELLCAGGPAHRLALLAERIEEAEQMLRFRLDG